MIVLSVDTIVDAKQIFFSFAHKRIPMKLLFPLFFQRSAMPPLSEVLSHCRTLAVDHLALVLAGHLDADQSNGGLMSESPLTKKLLDNKLSPDFLHDVVSQTSKDWALFQRVRLRFLQF